MKKTLEMCVLFGMLVPDKTFVIAMQIGEFCLESVCEQFKAHIFQKDSIVLYSGSREVISINLQNWVYQKLNTFTLTNYQDIEFSEKEKEFYLGLLSRAIVVYVCLIIFPENPVFGTK